jgi:HK97 family phage prohead protease
MLWQHDPKQPLGIWLSLAENDRGLKVSGQLGLGTPVGDYAYVMMKMEALKGLSIGYDIIDAEPAKGNKPRMLKKLDLWEISPVTFPMNTRATISRVKSLAEARTERELESALREVGLSISEAKHVISICRHTLREAEKDDGKNLVPMTEMLKLMQELNTFEVQQAVGIKIDSII